MPADRKRYPLFTRVPRPSLTPPGYIDLLIGNAFEEEDGTVEVVLDAVPVSGRVHFRREVPRG